MATAKPQRQATVNSEQPVNLWGQLSKALEPLPRTRPEGVMTTSEIAGKMAASVSIVRQILGKLIASGRVSAHRWAAGRAKNCMGYRPVGPGDLVEMVGAHITTTEKPAGSFTLEEFVERTGRRPDGAASFLSKLIRNHPELLSVRHFRIPGIPGYWAAYLPASEEFWRYASKQRRKGTITAPEAARKLSRSRCTVHKILDQLVAAGLVKWEWSGALGGAKVYEFIRPQEAV